MERIGTDERRARLLSGHHLSRRARSVEEAVAGVVGLHSSDPASVYLAARARVEGFAVADLEDALYQRRSLVRMLGMRRTMFVVPTGSAGVIDAACTQALAPGQRRRLERMVEEQGLAGDAPAWVAAVAQRTYEALLARGQATAAELSKDVPELRSKLTFGEGKTWGGTSGISTRMLFLLATEGRIVRGRPLGSWTSSQYRWAPVSTWLGSDLPHLPATEARVDLLRRWLRAFGPGTEVDIRWWTGWTARQVRGALSALDAVEVTLSPGTGWILPDDREAPPPVRRRVALLPALDPSVMGWKERDWYLGPHASALFDRNGNAGPTVWVDGRVVGGWGQDAHGHVVARILEPVGRRAKRLVDDEVAAVGEWLAGTRVTPRFRTPLEREMVTERGGVAAAPLKGR